MNLFHFHTYLLKSANVVPLFKNSENNESKTENRNSLHSFIIRTAAAFGRYPIDDLIRVGDVARFAVNAI